jgi:hypothetical protein
MFVSRTETSLGFRSAPVIGSCEVLKQKKKTAIAEGRVIRGQAIKGKESLASE